MGLWTPPSETPSDSGYNFPQAFNPLQCSILGPAVLQELGGNTEVQSGPEWLRERAYLEASVVVASLKCEVTVGKMDVGNENSSSCNMEIFSPLLSLEKGYY